MDIATKTSILAKKFADISTPSQASTTARKPKKGMATVKQRLGKILKLNKFARFWHVYFSVTKRYYETSNFWMVQNSTLFLDEWAKLLYKLLARSYEVLVVTTMVLRI